MIILKVKKITIPSLTTDAWEEEKHPRRPDGKFGKSGGENKNPIKIDNKLRKKYNEIFQGFKTSDGVEIKSVSDHAIKRMYERDISAENIKDILLNGKIKKGGTKRTTCYEKDGKRIVVDHIIGIIVTDMVIWR